MQNSKLGEYLARSHIATINKHTILNISFQWIEWVLHLRSNTRRSLAAWNLVRAPLNSANANGNQIHRRK